MFEGPVSGITIDLLPVGWQPLASKCSDLGNWDCYVDPWDLLGLQGVPREAKTVGTGIQLFSKCADPLLALIGAQILDGASKGRVLSESGGGLCAFPVLIDAAAQGLYSLANRGAPSDCFHLYRDAQGIVRIDIPPPANAPYTDETHIGLSILTQATLDRDYGKAGGYQLANGFPVPAHATLVDFINKRYVPMARNIAPCGGNPYEVYARHLRVTYQAYRAKYPPAGPPAPPGPVDPPLPNYLPEEFRVLNRL